MDSQDFRCFRKLLMSTPQKTQREAKKYYKPNGCVRQGRQGSQYDTRVQKSYQVKQPGC